MPAIRLARPTLNKVAPPLAKSTTRKKSPPPTVDELRAKYRDVSISLGSYPPGMRIPFNAACDFLGISISTAERLVRDGKLTCMRNAFTNRREFEVTYLRKLREG